MPEAHSKTSHTKHLRCSSLQIYLTAFSRQQLPQNASSYMFFLISLWVRFPSTPWIHDWNFEFRHHYWRNFFVQRNPIGRSMKQFKYKFSQMFDAFCNVYNRRVDTLMNKFTLEFDHSSKHLGFNFKNKFSINC